MKKKLIMVMFTALAVMSMFAFTMCGGPSGGDDYNPIEPEKDFIEYSATDIQVDGSDIYIT